MRLRKSGITRQVEKCKELNISKETQKRRE
jgi:hypothetical protein